MAIDRSGAPSEASRRAARPWASARSPAVSPPSTASRTSACWKRSGRPSSRIPARTSWSAARAAGSAGTPRAPRPPRAAPCRRAPRPPAQAQSPRRRASPSRRHRIGDHSGPIRPSSAMAASENGTPRSRSPAARRRPAADCRRWRRDTRRRTPRRPPSPPPGQRRRRRPDGEPARHEQLDPRRGAERAARAAGRALRGDHQHGQLLQPIRQEQKKSHRRLVRPVHVIDGEQLRPLRRQPRDEPVQAVEGRERRPRPRRPPAPARAAPPARRAPPRRQRARACRRRQPAQPRLEQLPHDAERVRALELGPARVRHRQVALERRRARPLQQRALPDPRRSLDQHQAAAPGNRLVEPPADGGELMLALQQGTGTSPPESKCGVQVRGAPRRDRRPRPATIEHDHALPHHRRQTASR